MEPGFRGVACALESHLGEAVAASKNSWDLGLFDTFHLAVVFRYGCESKALTKHWKRRLTSKRFVHLITGLALRAQVPCTGSYILDS